MHFFQGQFKNHRTGIVFGLPIALIILILLIGVFIGSSCVDGLNSRSSSGGFCVFPESQHHLYLRMKDFGLAFGAVIGVLGVILGHALNNDFSKSREVAGAQRSMRGAAGHLAAEIEFHRKIAKSYLDFLVMLDDRPSDEDFDLLARWLSEFEVAEHTKKRFFEHYYSVRISSAGVHYFEYINALNHAYSEKDMGDFIALAKPLLESICEDAETLGGAFLMISEGEDPENL